MPANEGSPVAPPGWASEPLTQFIDQGRNYQFAAFHNKRVVVQDLCRLDRLLMDALRDWKGSTQPVPALLLFRSHSAFRAGVAGAMAGQCAEAPSLLRLCLECAGYAAVMNAKPELVELWLRRHDSDETKRQVRRAFTVSVVTASLRGLDPSLATAFSILYERLIDFGAHPNERMVTSNIKTIRGPEEMRVDPVYLQGDGRTLDFAFRCCA